MSQTKTLPASLVGLKAECRQEAAERYFQLCERADAPLDGDAELLLDCQQKLGRSDSDLQNDIELVARIRVCESLAVLLPERMAEEQRCNGEHGAAIAWAASEREKLDQAIAERILKTQTALNIATCARGEAKQASSELASLFDQVDAVVRNMPVERVRRERIAAGLPLHSVHGPSRVSMAIDDGQIPHGSRGFVPTASRSGGWQ